MCIRYRWRYTACCTVWLWVALGSGAVALMCLTAGDAWHSGHDAGGNQAEQGAYHPAASLRGLEVLESQHPLEGTGYLRVCVCVCARYCMHVMGYACVFKSVFVHGTLEEVSFIVLRCTYHYWCITLSVSYLHVNTFRLVFFLVFLCSCMS